MPASLSVRGRFDGERVELLERPPLRGPCDVTVEFPLSDEERAELFRRARGAWQDSRTTDEIIEDIIGSRTHDRESPEW